MTSALLVSRRRPSIDVVTRAAVTGLASAAPVTFLSFATSAVGQSLREGDPVPLALRAGLLTSDDWEILPVWLLGSVVVGGMVALTATAVWLTVARRAPTKLWLAHLFAAGVAAALSALPFVASIQSLALSTALLVGVFTLLAAPRVCLERSHVRSSH